MKRIIKNIIMSMACAVLGIMPTNQVSAAEIESLNARQQSVVTIAAFTAGGELGKLRGALSEGLQSKLTVNEIKEVIVQMYAYSGFPRSLNGLDTFMQIIQERRARGIVDIEGGESSPLPIDQTLLELGTANQTKLVGAAVSGPIYTFAPTVDKFLKEHLFGDIFGRDILDFQTREIATIAALAAMDGVEPQLQSHFNLGFNTGLTKAQMLGIVATLKNQVGEKAGNRANAVLNLVLQARKQ